MNAYRVALILCRAAIIALWWRASIGLVGSVFMALATQNSWFGKSGIALPSGTSNVFLPLGSFASAAIIAVFLAVFAPSLCAAATGSAMLEGESLGSRRALEPQERDLALTGAGFIVLFSGVAGILIFAATAVYQFSSIAGTQVGSVVLRYNLIASLISLALSCFVGFLLAFRLGLRRVIAPDGQGESA